MGMGSVYTPRLYGERTPERVLEVLEDWIDWHAFRLASLAPGQVDNLHYQDLAQEGRLAIYRLLERDPHIWAPKILRLAILAMYAARRRGRSVLRADPYHRLRTYEQVTWELMADGGWGRGWDGRGEEGMATLAVPFSCVDEFVFAY